MGSAETEQHTVEVPQFQQRMDSASMEKIDAIKLCLGLVPEQCINPTILSLGAGTGKVERAIASDFPQAHVVAIDLSLPMIEEIRKNAKLPTMQENLSIVRGSIDRLPFAEESCDIIIASSVVHEIASYRDHGTLGIHTEHFYQQVAKRLKHDGVFFIRDFVQPDNPDELVELRIGSVIHKTDANPGAFVDRFSQEFVAADFCALRGQIEKLKQNGTYGKGSVLRLKYKDAIEITAHYSWARRFDDEVKERYAYVPIGAYQEYIQNSFMAAGVQTNVIQHLSYLPAGYPLHISGRLDILEPGTDYVRPLTPFTGVIALQRTN